MNRATLLIAATVVLVGFSIAAFAVLDTTNAQVLVTAILVPTILQFLQLLKSEEVKTTATNLGVDLGRRIDRNNNKLDNIERQTNGEFQDLRESVSETIEDVKAVTDLAKEILPTTKDA